MAAILLPGVDANLKIRDVSKAFIFARAEELSFFTMAPKGSPPESDLFEHLFKTRLTPTDSAVVDGVDVVDADLTNNEANKSRIQRRIQKGRVAIGVGDIANQVVKEYGIPTNLMTDNMSDGMCLARENMELTCLKDGDSVPDDGTLANKTRGIANGIRSANPAGSPDLPLPTAALTPTASIVTGVSNIADTTQFSETIFRTIMRSIATTGYKKGTWDIFCTPATMDALTAFFTQAPSNSTSPVILRRFNQASTDTAITFEVMTYQTPAGKVRFHQHYLLPTGVHALIVDMTMVKIRTKLAPVTYDLPYLGGKRKKIIEYIFGLQDENPQSHGKITT